ncbi:MAG: DegT/DnrJ/EryC1/StrS family aminotransferase [Natrialbaceae archaeon]|nr:DegT/DnrJ/EryC1/StrS family aminotransferase [Natrialbaceae archaeon]
MGQTQGSGVSGSQEESVLEFIDRNAPQWRVYGSGKVALRDGLQSVQDRGSVVLIPSILPDALVEPILEAGFRFRFYDVTTRLSPDREHLQDKLDDDTAAVIVIDYFGFACTHLDPLDELCTDSGAILIEDAAHGPVSVDARGDCSVPGHPSGSRVYRRFSRSRTADCSTPTRVW